MNTSALNGLPDFGAPFAVEAGGALSGFAPFASGSFQVLPQALTIALNADRSPQLSLVLARSEGDSGTQSEYAVLDITVAGDFPMESCLTAARAMHAAATVAPVQIDGGFARLFSTNDVIAPASDQGAPVELGWVASGYARWTTRLSVTAGEILKQSLSSTTSLIGAHVEFAVAGVAPRVPATVSFVPSELMAAIAASLPAGMKDRRIEEAKLREVLNQPGVKAAISSSNPAVDILEALADRVATEFCSFAAAPTASDPVSLLLADPARLSAELTTWDLNVPTQVTRHWSLSLNGIGGFDAATSSSVVRYLTIPVMPLGHWNVDVTSNLPPHRAGVAEVGVTLDLPAKPPLRPSSASYRLPLLEPDDSASRSLLLSPEEPLAFRVTPYAVLASAAGGVHTYTGQAYDETETWVKLQLPQFPISFAHISATPRLLALCTISVEVSYTLTIRPIPQQFVLDDKRPEVSIAIPRTTTASSVSVTARRLAASGAALSAGSNAVLSLGPLPAGRLALDLPSFAGYGPHRITVSVTTEPTQPLALEFLPAAEMGDPAALPISLAFYAGHSTDSWGYFANSPFESGYCFRVSAASAASAGGTAGAVAGPWSAVQSAFLPLMVNADGTQSSAPMQAQQSSSLQASFAGAI